MRTRHWALLIVLSLGATTTGAAPAAPVIGNPHGEFRADCRQCHDEHRWSPARVGAEFDHGQFGEPLEGAHATVPCLLCHLDLAFSETTGSICADCHEDVHLGELGPNCDDCHSPRGFVDRAQDLRTHRATRFPLTGSHAAVDCGSCHPAEGGRAATFANTPTECYACHRADYLTTTNPPHADAMFPTDCAQCHSDITWGGSTFDHALTGFPLTGAHRTIDCQVCHPGFDFTAASADCYSCHQDDYTTAANPSHSQSGFSTMCALCHTTTTWRPATFDHGATAFPLTGAHVTVDCTECHAGNVYAGTPTDCSACHQADFDGALDPDHVTLVLPTNCESCHTTSRWDGAVIIHGFPIYSGPHKQSEWQRCSKCHEAPSNYTVFNCLVCHPHSDRAKTDEKHDGEDGYMYASPSCYECHPDGND